MDKQEYKIAQAIRAGRIKRLYAAGHNVRLGQAVARQYTDAPPVRFYTGKSPREVRKIVDRFNRRFGQLRDDSSVATTQTNASPLPL